MTEALFGFIGVIVGSLIPWFKDTLENRRSRKEFATYLAVRVICLLDEFAENCVDVVQDDGTAEGRPARTTESGECYCVPQVPLPIVPNFPEDLDWRSIETGLMYRILSLPDAVRRCDRYISASSEHAYPPDYEEVFEARQLGYAQLGLEALEIAGCLRTSYGLPKEVGNQWHFGWDAKEFFEERIRKFDTEKTVANV
ncbi:MAG: hypothetical protein ACPG1C_08665 [Alphaproteobacteria bacterium]